MIVCMRTERVAVITTDDARLIRVRVFVLNPLRAHAFRFEIVR
jgi:hypothetical protein